MQRFIKFIFKIIACYAVFAAFKKPVKKQLFVRFLPVKIRFSALYIIIRAVIIFAAGLFVYGDIALVRKLNEQCDHILLRQIAFIPIRNVCAAHAFRRIEFNHLNNFFILAEPAPDNGNKNQAQNGDTHHGAKLGYMRGGIKIKIALRQLKPDCKCLMRAEFPGEPAADLKIIYIIFNIIRARKAVASGGKAKHIRIKRLWHGDRKNHIVYICIPARADDIVIKLIIPVCNVLPQRVIIRDRVMPPFPLHCEAGYICISRGATR